MPARNFVFSALTLLFTSTPTLAFSFSSLFADDGSLSPNVSQNTSADSPNVPVRQPLLDATDWFLSEDAITESRGGVPRSDLAVYTTGNNVTSLTVPNEFFDATYDDFLATKEGDRVLLSAWEVSLVPLKPDVDPTGSTTGVHEMVAGVVERGGSFHIMGWTNILHRKINIEARDDINKIPASAVNGAEAVYIFDDRVRTMTSSHHQKSLVFAVNSSKDKNDQPVAYVGGLDFSNDRWDTIYHNNSAIRDAAGITYERKGWIDAHVRIHGPAAKDVANNFLARWNSAYLPCQGLDDDLLSYENPPYKSLPPLDYVSSNTSAKLGKQSVQIVRTFSCKYKHYKEFAPKGENSLFQARLKAIKNARNYIYIEDQYFILVPELLEALMEVMPRIMRLVVVVNVLEFKYQATGYGRYLYDMVSPILKAYPNKFNIYTIKKKLNIYVHSKAVVIDDVYLSVGSANWNRRGMTSDSEMVANIVDEDTIESPDGVTVNKLARGFRIRKFQEMTSRSYEDLDAMTLAEAFNAFEAAAFSGSAILQHLEVSHRAYYFAFTNFIRQNVDPQDTCNTN
ncbi:Phospholipase D delta [Phytophthora citrophthora]|uniref:phospholipase D n=1 Tax=Phytophthora citrophthora TaxID=4793 RepID=A0AAD9LG28_9STRA|nr:Phospholipase D delta [Phytophthora citrophthora]